MDDKRIIKSQFEIINILHVEDEQIDAQYFHELISRSCASPVHIDHVQKLSEAKKRLTNYDYDVILLDLTLPDANGIEAVDEIHQTSPCIPIITLSSIKDDAIYQLAVQHGTDDHIIKTDINSSLINRAINQAVERKKVRMELHALARIDPQTGLLNHNAFQEVLKHSMLQIERNHNMIALLYIDLDEFKYINDRYGYQVGDTVLDKVGHRLMNTIREQDTVSRFCSDEFVVILENIQSSEMARKVAQKILTSLQTTIQFDDKKILISAGIGIMLYDGRKIASSDELINNANLAKLISKQKGSNSITSYEPHTKPTTSYRNALNSDLGQALNNDEFFLEYQPQFNVSLGESIGAEALLRWKHPERGIILPNEFICLLESNGQILSVGEWVLATACSQWASWIGCSKISPYQKISINLSPRQCQQHDFIQRLESILNKTGLPPWSLDLELTEGILLEDNEKNFKLMHDLKELGVSITLDDFGTGFSSLSYLTQLPIDRLKVDQCFVREILHDHNAETIAGTIISLANNLGIEVVAEGVDQQEKIDLLYQHGCDLFQGFHLGMPMPAKDFTLEIGKHSVH